MRVKRILGAASAALLTVAAPASPTRATAVALAAALALVGAAPARADRWKAADVQLAMRVADAHWPASSCFGAHQIEWLRGGELDALFPGDNATTTANGDLGGCRVWLAWDRIDASPVWLCTILEHEYGHNAGMAHSSDPHDVMNPWQASTAPDCERAFVKRGGRRVERHRPRRRLARSWGNP
jgi:hypothetical protein